MDSFVFCRVFIVLVDFRLHCVTTVTPFIRRMKGVTVKGVTVVTVVTFCLTEGKNVNYITPRNVSLGRLC